MAGQRIEVDGGRTGFVLGVSSDGRLHQLAIGGPAERSAEQTFPTSLYPLALPTFGEEALREPALRITHADGSPSTRLQLRAATEEPHPFGLVHRIELTDRVHPVLVTLVYRTWPAHDLVEQWVEVANEGDEPITVHQIASTSPSLPVANPHLTHWGGGWANEWTPTTERLAPGVKSVSSHGGVRSSLHLSPLVVWSPDGTASETSGTALVVTVAHGGDLRFSAEVAPHGQGRLIAGREDRGSERTIDPGERFAAPAAVLAWTSEGLGASSRALHGWIRQHRLRDSDRPRAIAFNNWEAMGFELTTDSVIEVVDGAQAIGAELFLLDDGWFGTAHPRDDDTQGLGDWEVDRAKFPDGLQPVIDHTLARGMRFGLWVEPEMVNPRSALYEAHPDWVIHEPGRDRREERQQLVLDVLQPEVRAFVVEVVDRVLRDHRGITYLKWDANRDVFEAASTALPADRQAHLADDRVAATLSIMAELADRHPDVELMLCASGGGRSDVANLSHFHELWTSDNTDPVDRVRIQWGASHLLPAQVLGAHVTRWGSKPVDFGCAVALSARFGFDLDPRTMTDAERSVAAHAAQTARRIRPLVQFGALHRLVSPIDADRGALGYWSTAESRASSDDVAVLFAYLLGDGSADDDAEPAALRLRDLDPDVTYRVEEVTPGGGGEVVSRRGADLMAEGLAWPDGPAPAARVWLLSEG